ncbi:MAG: hypothetical protein V5A39_14050 [Haloarculaceae archaeon]
MVDTSKILELVPHYIAMLILVFVAVGILRGILPGVSLIVEFGVILVIVFAYPFVVRRLGYAPRYWKSDET